MTTGGSWLHGGANHIVNGNWATSVSSWAVSKNASIQQVNSGYGDATKGGMMTYPANPSSSIAGGLYQRGFSVVEGTEYLATFACKISSGLAVPDLTVTLRNHGLGTDQAAPEVYELSSLWKILGYGFTAGFTGSASINFECATTAGVVSYQIAAHFSEIAMYEGADLGGDYQFENTREMNRFDRATRTGALHSYIHSGSYRKFDVPVPSITSAGHCFINSFWAGGIYCYLAEDASDPCSLYTVKIMLAEQPLQTVRHPYGRTVFRGRMVLETSSAN